MPTPGPERPSSLALVALSLGVAGCPATALYRTAEPVPSGRWQLSAGASAGVLADREQDTRAPTGQGELGVRRGFGDHVDLGLKLYTFGLGLNGTFRYLHRGGWSLSVAPELSVGRTTNTSTATAAVHVFGHVAVPFTRRFSRAWALSFGPSLGLGLYYPETGGHARGVWVGGFVNVEARLGERWWLVPELTGYQVFSGDVPLAGGMISFGLGLRFGL